MADEARTSSAGASTIIKPPNKDFEVFLNFRGPDSHYTVVEVLYHALARAGVGVFYDDESIRQGDVIAEELEESIKKSKIYIPIFSKDYAASRWCLRELDIIIKCWLDLEKQEEKEKKMILPIFYDTEASKELKLKPDSKYKAALEKHEAEGKIEKDVLEGWEKALKTAAHFKGWNVNAYGLSKLTEEIVQAVSRKLGIQSDPEKEIDVYVGMRERREEIMDLLKLGNPDGVRVVTIYGIAGLGKTTLARLVFKELKRSSDFHGLAAFLSISDDTADIVSLQKDLISQFLKVNTSELTSADLGVISIKEKLQGKKVLVVLDGLDTEDQLRKLAGETSWFGKGSIVIITTKNIDIITLKGEGCYEYKMPKMKDDDAWKLLCRTAFNSDSPPEEIDEKILQETVMMASGNPMAICEVALTLKTQ